jgi:cyclopropane-fatty-acyl-phospholipid synthase
MIEAVGEKFWPRYFEQLRDRLTAGGFAGVQAITIQDRFFTAYRREVDFIQRYIFPGGMLPTKALIGQHARHAGLRLVSSECFGQSYARTLAEWRVRFRQRSGAVQALGFDQRFRRLWEYYLAYCEAGFTAGTIDVGLFVLEPDPDRDRDQQDEITS